VKSLREEAMEVYSKMKRETAEFQENEIKIGSVHAALKFKEILGRSPEVTAGAYKNHETFITLWVDDFTFEYNRINGLRLVNVCPICGIGSLSPRISNMEDFAEYMSENTIGSDHKCGEPEELPVPLEKKVLDLWRGIIQETIEEMGGGY
jgi:hypothetical protein